MSAQYKNFQHYLNEGWAQKPKEIFKFLDHFITLENKDANANVLDIGCATGELIHYLSSRHPGFNFTGVDIFDDLVTQCRVLQSNKTFEKASVLDLPSHFHHQFDLVTAIGVLSIFDEAELPLFFKNLIQACRQDGIIFIISPLNEFGVDCEIKHRKWRNKTPGVWEKGWNIFSHETIAHHLQNKCKSLSFHPFTIGFDIEKRQDQVRTWTMKTEKNDRQLTNGLKLLIDHYLIKMNL